MKVQKHTTLFIRLCQYHIEKKSWIYILVSNIQNDEEFQHQLSSQELVWALEICRGFAILRFTSRKHGRKEP